MPEWILSVAHHVALWLSEAQSFGENVLLFGDKVLRPLTGFFAIPGAFASFATWYVVTLGRGRRLRRAAKNALLSASEQPAAILIINLMSQDIFPQVQGYLKQHPLPAPVPPELVFPLHHPGDLTADKVPNLVLKLRDIIKTMAECGVRHVHLFFAGPVAFAAIAGCELKHPFTVTLYQKSRASLPQDYECWGVLLLPAV
jgi:hypothetical protein